MKVYTWSDYSDSAATDKVLRGLSSKFPELAAHHTKVMEDSSPTEGGQAAAQRDEQDVEEIGDNLDVLQVKLQGDISFSLKDWYPLLEIQNS